MPNISPSFIALLTNRIPTSCCLLVKNTFRTNSFDLRLGFLITHKYSLRLSRLAIQACSNRLLTCPLDFLFVLSFKGHKVCICYVFGNVHIKQKLQYPVRILEFLVGAGRLRKPGCFCSVFCDRAAAVRIHPSCVSLTLTKKKNACVFLHKRSLGGRGWIRTTEAIRSRFTVCPHWPLGNTPTYSICNRTRIACI